MTDPAVRIARLEERIDGLKENHDEKLSGTTKAILILVEANKDLGLDEKKKREERDTERASYQAKKDVEISELRARLASIEQKQASATQVKVALIAAGGALAVSLAKFFLG